MSDSDSFEDFEDLSDYNEYIFYDPKKPDERAGEDSTAEPKISEEELFHHISEEIGKCVLLMDGQLLREKKHEDIVSIPNDPSENVVELAMCVVKAPLMVSSRQEMKERVFLHQPFVEVSNAWAEKLEETFRDALSLHGIFPNISRMSLRAKQSTRYFENFESSFSKNNTNDEVLCFSGKDEKKKMAKKVQDYFEHLQSTDRSKKWVIPIMTLSKRKDAVVKVVKQLQKSGCSIPYELFCLPSQLSSGPPDPSCFVHTYEDFAGGEKFLNQASALKRCPYHEKLASTYCCWETVNSMKNALKRSAEALYFKYSKKDECLTLK